MRADGLKADGLRVDHKSQLAAVDAGQVTAIASEVFAALVDGRTGLLTPWQGGPVTVADPLHAWVDLKTEPASRVQLTTDGAAAEGLTRALLTVDDVAPLTRADVADAFGELANVIGGNIKALLAAHVGLTLPQVSRHSRLDPGAVQFFEVPLDWRGHPLVISLWTI